MTQNELLAIAHPLGLIMLVVGLLVATLCIVANEYFKRHGLPADDESEES